MKKLEVKDWAVIIVLFLFPTAYCVSVLWKQPSGLLMLWFALAGAYVIGRNVPTNRA